MRELNEVMGLSVGVLHHSPHPLFSEHVDIVLSEPAEVRDLLRWLCEGTSSYQTKSD
jgi:hypothetical protein